MSEQLLPIKAIRRDPGLQMRLKEDPGTLDRYTELLSDPEHPDPPERRLGAPVVFEDKAGIRWLADGFHTLTAAERAGLEKFYCDVRRGSRQDAMIYAAGANAKHGLPRSLGDRLKAVGRILKEFGDREDDWIAKICHVRASFVKKVRAELEAPAKAPPEPEPIRAPAGPTAAQQLAGMTEQEKLAAIAAAEESEEERTKPCNTCYGKGTCPRCAGSGICPRCAGTNKVVY